MVAQNLLPVAMPQESMEGIYPKNIFFPQFAPKKYLQMC